MKRARLSVVPVILATLALAAALAYSIVVGTERTWRVTRTEYASYSGYTSEQRSVAFGAQLPLPMDIFEFYRAYLRPGDRYWVQIQNGGFGEFIDKQTAVDTVARLFLLPAVEVPTIGQANVVLSWDTDPGTLHRRFLSQDRSGQQLIFVSRLADGA